ncbi:MAG: patatin-like phospholipase family protein [Planctomycetes bacterium]|nr:patatin-like phospholipase family protein [Planctomycetota bacterium]
MPYSSAGWVWLICVTLALPTGCRYRQTTNCPTPAASGLHTRDLIDPVAQAEGEQFIGVDRFNESIDKRAAHLREELRKDAPPGQPPRNVLCLSGGGSYGAYSAGVLVGWTCRGDRPQFDVVTGISTGALIAPFAFLGSNYDAQLQEFYTTITNDDIFKKQLLRGLLGGDAFTDTTALRKKLSGVLTCEVVAEIAAAHQAGRRLMIGTTEEEGKRFILWNIGEIASRNGPRDRDLIIEVLIGSSAIPGAFPASKIDVYVDGKCYTERHVDGGVSQGLFFYPPYVSPEARNRQTMNLVDTNVYVIVAGKLYADSEVIKASALSQASKNINTVLYAQTRGDLQRLWTYCVLNGMNYNLTAIPAEYPPLGSSGEFDPKVMTALFKQGQSVICSANAWRTTPPVTDAAHGELPQVRWGRDLTFHPRGPQLPIPGPKKMIVQPKYPGAFSGGIPALPVNP